jgi:hypothetical protein
MLTHILSYLHAFTRIWTHAYSYWDTLSCIWTHVYSYLRTLLLVFWHTFTPICTRLLVFGHAVPYLDTRLLVFGHTRTRIWTHAYSYCNTRILVLGHMRTHIGTHSYLDTTLNYSYLDTRVLVLGHTITRIWTHVGTTPDSPTRALWQSYQQRHMGQVGGMDEGVRILPISIWNTSKDLLTCSKILRHGTSGFTSHPKEGVLRIFIALKKSIASDFDPATLGSSGKHINHYTTEATCSGCIVRTRSMMHCTS